eukprot:710342-Prymnesium_polylepis.1
MHGCVSLRARSRGAVFYFFYILFDTNKQTAQRARRTHAHETDTDATDEQTNHTKRAKARVRESQ